MSGQDDPFADEMADMGPEALPSPSDDGGPPERYASWVEAEAAFGRDLDRTVGAEARAKRFPLVPFDKIPLGTVPRYIVRGVLPLTGLVVAWGPPKCGKSFVMMDMLLHVALGWEYRGRRVRQGPIVYCALEGQVGFEARAAAFRQERMAESAEPVPFFLMPAALSLVVDVTSFLARLEEHFGPGAGPAVVCLDTLNRSFAGSESDDEAMTAYVRAADAIRDRFGCLVVVIHHCGIDGTRPRGSTALIGALDAQLAVKKAEGSVSLIVELLKDGEAGEVIVSRLRPVEVGRDEEGEAITSLVVDAVDGEAGAPAGPRTKRLTERNRLGLDALREAVMATGADAPASLGLPAGIKAVTSDAWKEEMFRRGIVDREARGHREQFRRVKLDLMERKAIAERDGLVWIVP